MGPLGLIIPMEGGGADDAHHWPPGVHSFDPKPFFPDAGMDWLNTYLLQAVIATVLVIGVWLWFAKDQRVVPGFKQWIGEQLYNLVRNGIGREALGPDYRRFTPYLVALFSFILVNNLFGQFFLSMFPTFSRVGYAYGLALLSWLLYNGVGIAKHGLGGYLKLMTMPKGVPGPLYAIIIPLEILSNFIVRPITLALRLFANLFAGHLVVIVFVVGGSMLLENADFLYKIAGGASLLMAFPIFGLELFIGALQAYIFTVLTAQYVASSLAEDH
ncbi:MAG TPA: F0F1 ATP synthase subunit A [Micropruina sp.]|nr:F0F1 ATP synthase subunit A [Propionibacterium sp.]HMQ38758.1 F0F1 ATP synthase subunit A [Micropruina sp.]HMR22981.1 F0F1 ATP synthase subunit A [Micropruina sp.]